MPVTDEFLEAARDLLVAKGADPGNKLSAPENKRFRGGPKACLRGKPVGAILDSMKRPTISCSAEVMGGTPVFAGTRVPIQTLLETLEAGESIDDFLEGFPMVPREQVISFLEEAKDLLVAKAS